jgi:hypothetical protein
MLWLTVWSLWQAASQVAPEYDDLMYDEITYPNIRERHRILGPSFPQT